MSLRDFPLGLMPELDNDVDIEGVVSMYYNNLTKDIDNSIVRYQSVWDHINDRYMKALEKYLNISWSGSDQIIVDVGYIPVSPRYLDNCSFSITLTFDDDGLVNIVSHEVLHFYWFMKFKEVFPDIKCDEYDFPNLPWKYSEMVTEAILNSKEVASVLNVRENCCYNFNRDIIDKLSNIFASSIPIEEKIKSGYELISNTNL